MEPRDQPSLITSSDIKSGPSSPSLTCHEVDIARVHGEELEDVEEVGHRGQHQRGLHAQLGHQGRGWETGEGEDQVDYSTPRNICRTAAPRSSDLQTKYLSTHTMKPSSSSSAEE